MRLTLITTALVLFFSAGQECRAQAPACPDAISVASAVCEDHLKSWSDLYQLFKRYHGCDTGALAEGYSDFVVRTLAHQWDGLEELKKLIAADKTFEEFVLKHIDASADPDHIVTVLANVKERCPANSAQLCSSIEKAVRKALQDLGALKKSNQ
jgi:hypothetical protein